jgi:predicted NUDIX family phosphoesterase
MSLPKGSEFTYGVHARSVLGLVKDNKATIMEPAEAASVLEKMSGMLMGSVRSLNDTYELLRQGIAYTLPFKLHEGKLHFLVYKRTKRNNEGRLAEKLSLAPGGHIEGRDLSYYMIDDGTGLMVESDTICWGDTLMRNMTRELCEEVDFTSKYFEHTERHIGLMASAGAKAIGFVMDSKPEIGFVGNTHIGIIHAAQVPSDAGFVMKDEYNTSVGWMIAEDLLDHVLGKKSLADGENGPVPFEPWSEMIIGQIEKVEQVLWQAFDGQ